MFYKNAFNNNRVLAPTSWDELSQGEWVQAQIDAAIEPWLSRMFGYHLLKIGALSGQLETTNCAIRHQINLAPELGADVIAEPARLPFQESCVDGCVLALTLNFHHNPHQLLREVNRVTVPGGHVLIVGLNPISPLGLASLNPQFSHKYPFNGRFFTQSRVKDWLAVLGYKVVASQKLIYTSLLTPPHYTRYLQSLLGNNIPSFGSFYCIMAKKLVRPLTPVKPRWVMKPKPLLNPVATITNAQSRNE